MSGRASKRVLEPTESTIRRLFASQEECAFPACVAPLVVEDDRSNASINVKIAHIIAASPAGPRPQGKDADPDFIRSFENLLLMCGMHHKLVDDHWEDYPADELREWKAASTSRDPTGNITIDDTTDLAVTLYRAAYITQDNRGDHNVNVARVDGDFNFGPTA